jgi:hypothetical protein
LLEYKYRNNTILGFRGAEAMPSEELLVIDCEILIPAATENVITSRNADKIKARIVVEGANGPTTAVADEILAEKRIFIVPDILANAGGVTASYFEWVQDRQGYFWKEAIVNEQLERFCATASTTWCATPRPQREQPHRGLHAGHRSRGLHHQAARHLRLVNNQQPGGKAALIPSAIGQAKASSAICSKPRRRRWRVTCGAIMESRHQRPESVAGAHESAQFHHDERIIMIPLFLWILSPHFPWQGPHGSRRSLASILFVLASITDGLDGYLARKRGQITTMGMLLDPLADKIMVTAAFVRAGGLQSQKW